MRRIDHGGEEIDAHGPQIGDGKRPTAKFFGPQLFVYGTLNQFPARSGKFQKTFILGISDDRYDQAPWSIHCQPHVHSGKNFQLIAHQDGVHMGMPR